MTWRVSKDGSTFHEIDEDFDEESGLDRSLEAAKAKGYKPYVQMTKNGKDVFDVEASEDSYKAALEKGYKEADVHEFTKNADKTNKAESTYRGAMHGLSGSYIDELGGALEAAGSTVGLRGVGSSDLTDIRLETDEEDKESLGDTYRGMRDKRRQHDKKAEASHPELYNGADIAGSVVSGMAIPGSSLKAAAFTGGSQGLGRSEADLTDPSLENYGQAAVDTAFGAATGYAGGLAAKGVAKGVSVAAEKGSGAIKTAHEYLKNVGRGAKAGAKSAGDDMPGNWLKDIAAGVGAVKGAVKEIKEMGAAVKEFTGVAKEARDILAQKVESKTLTIRPLKELQAIGNGKTLAEFSDDEAVVGALMMEGDNSIKKWFAEKAATLHPGQIDADEYGKVLGLGTEARSTARAFDARAAAKDLRPVVEDVQSLFKEARDARYGKLNDAAKESFDSVGAGSVLTELDEAIADAGTLSSVPGSVRNLLDDVKGMLNIGKGTKQQKLVAGAWDEVAGAEKFNRLQQSRQLIDQQIKWAKREGLGQSEQILRSVRSKIDDALKTSPDKIEADALYRTSKDVEGKFFGATEFRNQAGGIEVDEGKLARLLGNTDGANRFKASMDDLKAFAKHPDLDPKFKAKANSLIADLEKNMGIADTKRAVSGLRFQNGPSSPAIERMGSVAKGNTLLKDAVQSPAGFVNNVDQFNSAIKSRLGKGFDALDAQEKSAAVKFFVWMKANPDASKTTADKVFLKFLGK